MDDLDLYDQDDDDHRCYHRELLLSARLSTHEEGMEYHIEPCFECKSVVTYTIASIKEKRSWRNLWRGGYHLLISVVEES